MDGPKPAPGMVLKDRGWEVYVCAPIFMTLATVAVGMRIYGRRVIVGHFGLDDWLMVVAYFFSLIYTGNCLGLVYYGTGKPDHMLTPFIVEKNLLWSYAWHQTYNLAVLPLKLSILLFYLRLSTCRTHIITLYCIITLIVMYTVATSIVFIFRCNPIPAAWNMKTFPAGCINLRVMLVFWTSFNVFTDIIIYTIPLPIIFKMRNINLRKKLSLTVVFATGLVAVIGSIGRIVTFMGFDYTRDMMWQSAPVVNWSLVELSLAIVAASVPGIKPIFMKNTVGSSGGVSRSPVRGSPGLVHVVPGQGEWSGSTLREGEGVELQESLKHKPKRPSVISITQKTAATGVRSESQECIVTVDVESIGGSDTGGGSNNGGSTRAGVGDLERQGK
ncbi:hypothetical protein EDC01DRAFT_320984 [Geopyxis carbonaria]|nr:hypothetical protein EDC01DRAFT_320984 [Geopyxis carbonaria]